MSDPYCNENPKHVGLQSTWLSFVIVVLIQGFALQ